MDQARYSGRRAICPGTRSSMLYRIADAGVLADQAPKVAVLDIASALTTVQSRFHLLS